MEGRRVDDDETVPAVGHREWLSKLKFTRGRGGAGGRGDVRWGEQSVPELVTLAEGRRVYDDQTVPAACHQS